MKRNLPLFALLVCTATACVRAQTVYEDLKGALQKEMQALVTHGEVPGMLFSVALDSNHTITLAAGYSDREERDTLTVQHKMFSGSTGKLFFASLALRLVQEGKMSLDDKVSDYLGDRDWYSQFPNAEEIRIRNLLNHTSGLPRYLFQPEFLEALARDPLADRSPEASIQSVRNKPAVHEVGKGWAYSDTNFILLGLVLEKILGEPLYERIRKDFLDPLELSHTVPSRDRKIPGLAQGYVGEQNPFNMPPKMVNEEGLLQVHPGFEWAGGGFATHPEDLATLIRYIRESDYLSEPMKQEMTKAVHMGTGLPYDQGYGLGMFIWAKKEDTRYGHLGFFPGYVTVVEYSGKRQYALALQINHDGAYGYLQPFLHRLESVLESFLPAIDESKIRENFTEQERCWNSGDLECYMKAYAPAADIQTVSRAGITYGYDQILANYRSNYPKEKMGTLGFDQLTFRRLADDLYFVTGRFNLHYSSKPEPVQGRFSTVMVKQSGKWYLLTDHSG